jgi:hypothetical protein
MPFTQLSFDDGRPKCPAHYRVACVEVLEKFAVPAVLSWRLRASVNTPKNPSVKMNALQ